MSTTSPTAARIDAPYLLGFMPPSRQTLPDAEPGMIVLRYGGWSFQELHQKQQSLFHDQTWYDEFPWASEKLPSGIYVLRLPIPGSNHKTFDEQSKLLLSNEEPAPVVIAATALLSIHLSGQPDPLKSDWVRCKEQTAGGYRVALGWLGGRLSVNSDRDVGRDDDLGLSSSRKVG